MNSKGMQPEIGILLIKHVEMPNWGEMFVHGYGLRKRRNGLAEAYEEQAEAAYVVADLWDKRAGN